MESFLRGRAREKVVSIDPPVSPHPFIRSQPEASAAPAASGRDPFFGASPPEHGEHGQPQVELVCAEGRVSRIVITCTCGQRTELDCEYPAR